MLNILKKKILEIEDIKQIKPNLDALKIIPKNTAEKIQAIPFDINKKNIYILTTNNYPNLLSVLEDKLTSKWYKREYFYTDEDSFWYALTWYKQLEQLEEQSKKEVEEFKTAEWKKAFDLIKKLYQEKHKYSEWEFIMRLIKLAFKWWWSDLHFQPEEIGVVTRVRKDGILRTVLTFSHNEFKKYLLKLKYISWVRMNIDYIPQDGRFDFTVETRDWKEKKIDVRVSFMPWLRWESVVMRFLDSSRWIMSFTQIWFLDESLDILERNLRKNYWMILVTWPTWSWKTTTLYSMLNFLNDPWKKIITLEDTVEYELPGIQQSQINEKKWYTYEEWLKAILRQDPDIIMVWEIRTKETAEIAINAALTWHLVISTLHTNTAIEAVSRLLNMGIKPYLLAPALNLIIW
jgi:type IV pilus assembly protein PilB